jgi:DNA polymerase-3 subunit epsilon/ATP-dependent DNA helicase DinG
MSGRIYVALDLETTGLDANRDAIIEIGAVRFQDDAILDRFSTLVDPRRPIPARIQQITGIRDADVADAPTIDQAAPELLAFVDATVGALVAHNASFDLGFLRAVGINFHRPALDTLELASILLPGQASYSLGELCHRFDIPLVDAHRAHDDAAATAQLFMRLMERLSSLPSSTLQAIVAMGGESDWPPMRLFTEAIAPGRRPSPEATTQLTGNGFPVAPVAQLSDSGTSFTPASLETLHTIFSPNGSLAQLMGMEYEARPGQVDMAERVLHALNRGDHLLVEAGTGTGKSLAYLLPAALWSAANQRRVVIATNTITLQDQLLDKDIPQVQAIFQTMGLPAPEAALLKGRTNYLCLRRFHSWCSGRAMSPAELSVMARVLVWLPTTSTGDVSELALSAGADREIWQQICSDSATCGLDRCGVQHNSSSLDFYLRAQRQAEHAHLLVVNHALLLADINSNGRVLPTYSHLIVDEAHRLEEAATDQLTYRVEWTWVRELLRRLMGEGGLYRQINHQAGRQLLVHVQEQALAAARCAERTLAALRSFAEQLLHFALQQDVLRSDAGYAQRLLVDGRIRSQPMWSQVEIEWDLASEPLTELERLLDDLVLSLSDVGWGAQEPNATLLDDVRSAALRLHELAERMGEMVLAPSGPAHSGQICWIEVNEQRNAAGLASAPLHVSDLLQNEIINKRRSAIFTGATLRTGANFRFIRERLGLWDVSTAIVESPFDYRRSALLYLPSDLPAPNQSAYQSGVERAILDAVDASDGRTLVLFTSYAQLRTTADALRAPLERLGVAMLQHGVNSRRRLLRDFRNAERAVLFGTRSFWEGVDLPGDELRCLLIVRLPFSAPNDPLAAARSAECEDPFTDYTLPEAILRFRQGFGRLIRRASDRGVVVILDSRLWRKQYGQAFLDALPPCTVRNAPLSVLGSEVRRWLAGS